ncbi:hypothetical protein DPEC_G00049060 [Dallia pectoralis]|uniref:Uncharacterized protein n=1 Tax=Dallia pectoralis TaxID=75939 RepID=A0ACC2HAL9_DALPE|nr:hypothetical protein DPEC_G00049060 [Dallia pectoralis]
MRRTQVIPSLFPLSKKQCLHRSLSSEIVKRELYQTKPRRVTLQTGQGSGEHTGGDYLAELRVPRSTSGTRNTLLLTHSTNVARDRRLSRSYCRRALKKN